MGDAARAANERKSTVTPRKGRYVGNDGMLALVDLGDQRVPVQFATAWVPQINEPVWVDSIDGVLRLTGPTMPKPGVGVILTVTGTSCEVRTDFGDFRMPIAPSSATPSSGDTVGISWSSQPWCALLVDVPDPEEPPEPPSAGASEVKTAEFRAIDAGSTDRGSPRWWQAQPWASNTTFGAWFYGSQIKDTIPAGATLVYENGQPQIFLFIRKMQQNAGGTPRFALHNQFTKGPVPAYQPFVEWNPPNGWQTPPDPEGWFSALKAGGGAAGVGLNQGGWSQYASLAQDGMSGALLVKWR